METLRLFGTNGITTGKFLPLLKGVRLTAKLKSEPVKLGGANNDDFCIECVGWCYFWFVYLGKH
jgi:hypothetical protein